LLRNKVKVMFSMANLPAIDRPYTTGQIQKGAGLPVE
jgi:hypothetical protein